MEQVNKLFTLENITKLALMAGFGYNIIVGIESIKADIKLMKQGTIYEVKSLQYQIDECCKNKNKRLTIFNQQQAILPNGINLEDE